MSLRFRHSFQLFPGVQINVGARGVSASFGVPGATVNIGGRGVRATVGLPGTGVSYSTALTGGPSAPQSEGWPGAPEVNVYQPRPAQPNAGPSAMPYRPTPGMREIGSASVETLTSEGLVELRDMILAAREQSAAVEADLATARRELDATTAELERRRSSLFRWFYRKRIAVLRDDLVPAVAGEVERLSTWRDATHIDVAFETADTAQRSYAQLVRSFEALRCSQRVWDVTSDRNSDRVRERTSASRILDRHAVRFEFASSDLIRFAGKALRFENVNGEDILLYPGMAVMPRADGMFALIDLRDIRISYRPTNFIEHEPVADDAAVVGHTWAKVNKDGSPDRRFRDNYQVPICCYGELAFSSSSGITEEYQVSQVAAAEAFAAAFTAYQQALAS